MPYDRNIESQKALRQEIKALKGRCIEVYNNVFENEFPKTSELGLGHSSDSSENISHESLCYLEALRTEIMNSNTPINTDENFLTSQILSEIKEKTSHIEELNAFTRGSIYDIDREINRLDYQIKIAQEAKASLKPGQQQVQPHHLQKAKDRFNLMKNELHGLIGSLFPDKVDGMKDILGQLMSEKLNESSNGYIAITTENYKLIQVLKERYVVSVNPYNTMEVKLAYD